MSRHDVVSPMTGTILEVLVTAGEAVGAGQELVVVESMKMEIPIESPVAGTVAEVLVSAKDRVDEGHVLARVEA